MIYGGIFTAGLVLLLAIFAMFDKSTLQNKIRFKRKVPSIINFTPKELKGPMAINNHLLSTKKLFQGQLQGPETIIFTKTGEMIASSSYNGGVLYKLHESNNTATIIAKTKGLPLGFEEYGDSFIVADAQLGLLKVTPGAEQEVEVLTTSYESYGGTRRITYADDVAVDEETDKIYFTNACFSSPDDKATVQKAAIQCLVSLCGGGAVLEYDIKHNTTKALKTDLYFANGITIIKSQDHPKALLVADTFTQIIWRYYLDGPRAGSWDKFMDTLGMVDNIVYDEVTETVWLAFQFSPHKYETLNQLMNMPIARQVLLYFPALIPKKDHVSAAAQVDLQGTVLRSVYDPDGAVLPAITHVIPRAGDLYIGGVLKQFDFVGKVKL